MSAPSAEEVRSALDTVLAAQEAGGYLPRGALIELEEVLEKMLGSMQAEEVTT